MATFDSWRLQVNFENRTGRTIPGEGVVGGTVVRSHRGLNRPIRFGTGETRRMLNLLGAPTPERPDVIEAITFNESFPLWVQAPAGANARHGGVHVTKDGVEPFVGGIDNGGVPDGYAEWPIYEEVATGDGTETNFSLTTSEHDYYVEESIRVYINGEEVDNSTTTTDSGTIEIVDNDLGSGTFDYSDGSFNFTFESAPAKGDTVEVFYKADYTDHVYFSLVAAGPQDDVLGVNVEYDEDDDAFEVDLQLKGRRGNFNPVEGSPWDVSLDEDAVDSADQSIYIENVFDPDDNDWVIPVVNSDLYEDEGITTPFTDTTSLIEFDGGQRGDMPQDSDLTAAYQEFHKSRTYPINIFFDPTAEAAIVDEYDSMRGNSHKYERFILPLPNENVEDAITSAEDLGLDNRGLSLYWNWGKVRNRYSSRGNVWTPLTGRVAVKHAEIMDGAFGGLAPAWTNDGNGYGGTLPAGIIEMAYDPDQTQQQSLFNAGVNAIVDQPGLGIILTSERTAQNEINDDAYISHSGAKDYAVKQILNQVVPFQLLKMNDIAHRNTVTNRTTAILSPMTTPPTNVLREFAVKCDDENNNDDVLARDEFVLTVAIKVTPMSRWFVFNVVNTPQGASVEEASEV